MLRQSSFRFIGTLTRQNRAVSRFFFAVERAVNGCSGEVKRLCGVPRRSDNASLLLLSLDARMATRDPEGGCNADGRLTGGY